MLDNSTLSTSKDMLNDDGEEEFVVTAACVDKWNKIPEHVYAFNKKKMNMSESNSESCDKEKDGDVEVVGKKDFKLG